MPMRPTLLRAVRETRISPAIGIPIALVLASSLTLAYRPARISLITSSISWTAIWAICVLQNGLGIRREIGKRQKLCWAAGSLLALAQICEGALGDREALRWGKALVPVIIFLISRSLSNDSPARSDFFEGGHSTKQLIPPESKKYLYIATLSSLIILTYGYINLSTVALGLSDACFTALALVLIEDALTTANTEHGSSRVVTVSANGSLFRRDSEPTPEVNGLGACLRDVSMIIALGCLVSSFEFESFKSVALIIRYDGRARFILREGLLVVLAGTVKDALIVAAVHHLGSFRTGSLEVAGALAAALATNFTLGSLWFAIIALLGCLICLGEPVMMTGGGTPVKGQHILVVLSTVSFFIVALAHLWPSGHIFGQGSAISALDFQKPSQPFKPMQLASSTQHPIEQLIKDAEQEHNGALARQSRTLADAVVEYRRRYQLAPPPNFDKWFEFAKKKGVQLIDEYDTIHRTLVPFWALRPAVIRNRVREAIGYDDNFLVGFTIRDGEMAKSEHGELWQREATFGMMRDFIQFLPDMDLAFNIHDEPRIVVPHDVLSRMVGKATEEAIPAAAASKARKNRFSGRPADMNDGKRIEEYKTTRFNVYAHQQTWAPSRLSCSPDSPARDYSDVVNDNVTSWALSDLGFVYNTTAFTDICMTPSLKDTFGFFERPNAFNVAHELIPVFSQSKLSSYQDILYPSPWYWANKVDYDPARDSDWDKKEDKLYWRGSTTGGFSRSGGWRRQHRQGLVGKINSLNTTQILQQPSLSPQWHTQEVARTEYAALVDVKFSHIGQCDPGDCDAQKEFFTVVDRTDMAEGWRFRHLLDMDGNAFSGRFYAFLKSRSLPYKMALFREWHQEWLKPWVHYVPLSLRGGEWLEAVRYMSREAAGKEQAAKMARQGTDWANKVLRKEDFEVWFFRLLLEYGRLIDDDRDAIGYT